MKYAALNAEKYYQQGKKAGPIKKYLAAFFSFVQNYIFRRGFLDGKAGYQCAILMARYTFEKYRKLVTTYLSSCFFPLLGTHCKDFKDALVTLDFFRHMMKRYPFMLVDMLRVSKGGHSLLYVLTWLFVNTEEQELRSAAVESVKEISKILYLENKPWLHLLSVVFIRIFRGII